MLSRFHLTPERHGQTDGQTDLLYKYRASVCWRAIKTTLKALLAAAANRPTYVFVGFSRRKIPRSSAEMISERAIRFRHPDYNPDVAQKLISSSMFRHLSTRNISCKSTHAFFSNLRRIKFYRNPSITSSDIPLKCKNPVPGPAPPVRHLAEKFCTWSEYFTTSNCVFNVNFLALVVSEIIGGPKFTLRGLCPGRPMWKILTHPQILAYTYTSVSETIRKPPLVKAQTALETIEKIKYGEKRFSIWGMELLHPAMWHDHSIDFVR